MRQRRAPGLDVRELGRLDLLAADHDRAGVEEHAVLEGLVDVELERGGRRSSISSAPSRGVAVRTGEVWPSAVAEEDTGPPALRRSATGGA